MTTPAPEGTPLTKQDALAILDMAAVAGSRNMGLSSITIGKLRGYIEAMTPTRAQVEALLARAEEAGLFAFEIRAELLALFAASGRTTEGAGAREPGAVTPEIPAFPATLQPTMRELVASEGVNWEEGSILNNRTRFELAAMPLTSDELVYKAEKMAVWALRAALSAPPGGQTK